MDDKSGNDQNRNAGQQEMRLEKSALHFIDWKINSCSLQSNPRLSFLFSKRAREELWDVGLNFQDALYLKKENLYISTLGAVFRLMQRGKIIDRENEPLLTITANIVGLFSFSNDNLEKETKKNLILHQTPAILLPFLRAALASYLGNSGFDAPPFPLINLYDLSKTMPDLQIKEVEENPEPDTD